ncbi:hypothetical protein J2X06_001799 [Lysobacter niastensis]|uniref:Preprotein translocase subunit SecD n=1 Tax=Lysobacter niastensis TaxID=380629 RepID=A0ABU1WAI3_9GAMM|nr:hypothetical protein [Lysobacter niastensis]MDR7134615.1 hypothetical protein [Lysobacter niastensis]
MDTPRTLIVVTLLLAGVFSPATGAGQQLSGLGPEWRPVDPARLDTMRGGFQTTSGMTLSFGIERVVQVNGELLATTRVHIPDVARMTADQATELARFNEGMLIQIGPGNHFEPAGSLQGVVIQNSLDGQDIRAITTLNIGVDTLGAFQDMNAQAALRDALVNATKLP